MFEVGNNLGAKTKLVHNAIRRIMQQEDGARLRQALDATFDKAAAGDLPSLMFIRDTLDGKPAQSLTVSGDDDKPLITMIKMVIVQSQLDDTVLIQGDSSPLEIESIPSPTLSESNGV